MDLLIDRIVYIPYISRDQSRGCISSPVAATSNMDPQQLSKWILFASVLILSSALELTARKPQWPGVPAWGEYLDQQRSLVDYECSMDGGQCDATDNEGGRLKMIETNEVPFKRRDNIGFPTIASFDMDSKSPIIPYFHTSQPFACSCNAHPRLHDLGPGFYPRYLSTAVCSAEGCGGGARRCHQRLYKVRVLTRRDANNAEVDPNSALLPDALRKDWMFETFTVTVACECRA